MPYIKNDGVSIYYETVGKGAPLLLYHGLADSSRSWYERGYVDELVKCRQLILIDGRGHGRSSKPTEPESYSIRACVDDVLAVADELGLRFFDFFGCSMGGWIGFGLARYAPERLSCLIVNGAHAFEQSLAPLREVLAGGMENWIELIHLSAGLTPAQIQQLHANDIVALRAVVARNRPDLSVAMERLECPCLLLAGSEDQRVPLVRKTASLAPYGEFVELKGLNHFSAIIRSSQALAAIHRFLSPSLTSTTYALQGV